MDEKENVVDINATEKKPEVEVSVEVDEKSKEADAIYAKLESFCKENDISLAGGVYFNKQDLSGPVVIAKSKVQAAGLSKTIENHINNIL